MVEIGRKRKIEKKGETAGPIPFSFTFRTWRTKSFRFCLAVSRFLGWVHDSPGVSRSRRIATWKESIRGVRSRRFLWFFLVCREKSFSRRALVSASDDRRYMSHRIPGIYNDHRHTMNSHPHFTCRYVCMRVYKSVLMLACVHVCVCVSVCVSRSPSVLYLVYHERKKKERKLYIGTSKKVYFTIPLAVEDRILFIGFNYSIHRRKEERNRALYSRILLNLTTFFDYYIYG